MAQLTKNEKEIAKISVIGEAVSIVISIVGAVLFATGVGTIPGIFLLMLGLGGVCGFFPTLPLSLCTPPNNHDEITALVSKDKQTTIGPNGGSSKTIMRQTTPENKQPTSNKLSNPPDSVPRLPVTTTIYLSMYNFFNAIFSPDVPTIDDKATPKPKK